MPRVIHVIGAPNIVDINIIVVVPARWPSLIILEQIATIPEAVTPVDKPGTAHAERMATTKISVEMVIGNATVVVAIVSLLLTH
jgi:hypothetical protein